MTKTYLRNKNIYVNFYLTNAIFLFRDYEEIIAQLRNGDTYKNLHIEIKVLINLNKFSINNKLKHQHSNCADNFINKPLTSSSSIPYY